MAKGDVFVSLSQRRVTRCHADDDGCCDWPKCPQVRDDEPSASGRHCPLDADMEADDAQ
jgi:hypothetical protein